MKKVFSKIQAVVFVCGCSLIMSCVHRSANNSLVPVPWDSVPLIQEQKGYSLPPSLVVVDLEKDFPTLNLKIELKDFKYVPLETTPKLHLDKDRTVKYLSDKYCVIINRERGDVFVFNLDGKCVGNFNHQDPGPYGYRYIADIVVDEDAEEIFILTFNRSILVYTFSGKYQRKFYYPEGTQINKIINFNNTALLASGYPQHNMSENSLLKKTPYILLSKQTGEVIGSLNVRYPERQAILGGGDWYTTTPNMLKNGKDIYISNTSSDTLYHIEQDGKLKPFLVRTPSVFGKKPQMFFQITDKLGSYLLLEKTVNEIVPGAAKGQEFRHERYVLDLETGDMYKLGIMKFSDKSEDKVSFAIDLVPYDLAANTVTAFVDADELMDELKNGNVKSDELKKVISALHEEDNPVLVIIKF